MTEFTDLEKQSVREYWADEAREFTPWLAAQLDDDAPSNVEDLIQLDLTLQGTEQSVGRYNLDILAEAEDGRTVVIENQLEASDHDHLGKCLAYAS
jgi:RecB family endonuclease NucS